LASLLDTLDPFNLKQQVARLDDVRSLGERFTSNIEATYSRNMNQTGYVDLNFTPVQRFALADEAGRPVYVANTSISTTTGVIASRDARVSQQFNRVTSTKSDLQSEARQITFRLSPMSFSSSFGYGGGYTYSNARELSRGFGSGNTVGDRLARRAADPAVQGGHRRGAAEPASG